MRVVLMSCPGKEYLEAMTEAIHQAQTVTMITAFASSSGLKPFIDALTLFFERPDTQATLIIGKDKQGFNTVSVFELLLQFKEKIGSRLSLEIVEESRGLMHAKAMLAEGGSGGDVLVVGSANLTERGFLKNHELGVAINDASADVVSKFHAFVRELSRTPLDINQATRDFLFELGLLESRIGNSEKFKQLDGDAENLLWILHQNLIDQGYLVGRGRRGTDALSIRLPMDQLAAQGLIKKGERRVISRAVRESRSLGYTIDLLPTESLTLVRRAAKRVSALTSRLSLQTSLFWKLDA